MSTFPQAGLLRQLHPAGTLLQTVGGLMPPVSSCGRVVREAEVAEALHEFICGPYVAREDGRLSFDDAGITAIQRCRRTPPSSGRGAERGEGPTRPDWLRVHPSSFTRLEPKRSLNIGVPPGRSSSQGSPRAGRYGRCSQQGRRACMTRAFSFWPFASRPAPSFSRRMFRAGARA